MAKEELGIGEAKRHFQLARQPGEQPAAQTQANVGQAHAIAGQIRVLLSHSPAIGGQRHGSQSSAHTSLVAHIQAQACD
jgi:hypothetical protein